MTISKTLGVAPGAFSARIISVETDISRGLYMFSIVGLADRAVEESRERISSAIKNSGIPSPKTKNQKVTVSLAPAYLKKEGATFDLPIAICYLRAAREIKNNISNKIFIGELSLDGSIRGAQNILPIIQEAQKRKVDAIFIPKENIKEASLLWSEKIIPVASLRETIDHLNGVKIIAASAAETNSFSAKNINDNGADVVYENVKKIIDLKDIRGQHQAKRALLIAAAGKHNVILHGAPGTSKSILAEATQGILPSLTKEEAIETTSIYSAHLSTSKVMMDAPFRSPHHTSSYSAIIGGGAAKMGEITLAHNGILFLDELLEFDRRVIESLRQPLEERRIQITRAKGSIVLPANFFLIAAMNPCPCGFRGDKERKCTCMQHSINLYRKKLSGPLLDRIDIWTETARVRMGSRVGIESEEEGTSSEDIKKLIVQARIIQEKRFEKAGLHIKVNSEIPMERVEEICKVEKSAREILNSACEKLFLSPRAFHRTMRVARTIADLDRSKFVEDKHMLEALSLRPRI